MSVADKIYIIIRERNYKQSAIAVAAGYNPKTFNNLLKGRKKINANDIMPICTALGVTPNELFNYQTASKLTNNTNRAGRLNPASL